MSGFAAAAFSALLVSFWDLPCAEGTVQRNPYQEFLGCMHACMYVCVCVHEYILESQVSSRTGFSLYRFFEKSWCPRTYQAQPWKLSPSWALLPTHLIRDSVLSMLKVWHFSNSYMENLFQKADTSVGPVVIHFFPLLSIRATSWSKFTLQTPLDQPCLAGFVPTNLLI